MSLNICQDMSSPIIPDKILKVVHREPRLYLVCHQLQRTLYTVPLYSIYYKFSIDNEILYAEFITIAAVNCTPYL